MNNDIASRKIGSGSLHKARVVISDGVKHERPSMAAWSGPCLNSLPSFCSAGVEVLGSECTFSYTSRGYRENAHVSWPKANMQVAQEDK